MAFTLECPKCGSLNTASRFNPFKRTIQCATCGEEINVKQSRMISKTCHNCGKVIVCDQAKMKGKMCPGCGKPIGVIDATAEYKMADVICPQCNCEIEIDKTKETQSCPICDKAFSVKELLAKEKQVKDGGISVIQYEGDNTTFVWKHPIENFNWGSQLIVHESQEAIFFFNGQALDTFSKPGRYTLETENLPIMKKVYDLPTGKQNAFHAEVYFINKTVQMGVKWGTDSRVRFSDPATGIPLDIGASGEMNLQVSDGRKLLLKLVGTTGGLSQADILGVSPRNPDSVAEHAVRYDKDGRAVQADAYANERNRRLDRQNGGWASGLRGFFRPMIMTAVKSNLAAAIKTQRIDILEIDERLEELSESLREKISPKFEEYGLFVPQLYVTNVSLPEDDVNFGKIRELRSASFLGRREAEVEADILAAQRQKEIERQKTELEMARFEAEKKRIAAQAKADSVLIQGQAVNTLRRDKGLIDVEVMKGKGLAEAEVMKEQGYNKKDEFQRDVQTAYAAGIGSMGGGSGGSMASEIVGLGVGIAAAGAVRGQVTEALNGMAAPKAAEEAPESASAAQPKAGWKCACGCEDNRGKFCAECGQPKPVVALWDCPQCGSKGNYRKFCVECGAPRPAQTAVWDCPDCGYKGNHGKFCAECGRPRPAQTAAWDCPSCGYKGNLGKFCAECGKPRAEKAWDCSCGNRGIKGKFCPECGKKREETEE